jgi:hypothetical protein
MHYTKLEQMNRDSDKATFAKHLEQEYFVALAKLLSELKDSSVRIPESPIYIQSLGRFFVITLKEFKAPSAIADWSLVFDKFVPCAALNKAVVLARDKYMGGWSLRLIFSSPFASQPAVFHPNENREPFWFVFVNSCARYPTTFDVQKSLVMRDPLINEYVVREGVRHSVFSIIDGLGVADVLAALLTRPDLEITSRSVQECTHDQRCKELILARYQTKRATYNRMVHVLGILNGIVVIEHIVLDFLL